MSKKLKIKTKVNHRINWEYFRWNSNYYFEIKKTPSTKRKLSKLRQKERAHRIMPKSETHQQLHIELPLWGLSLITEKRELFAYLMKVNNYKPCKGPASINANCLMCCPFSTMRIVVKTIVPPPTKRVAKFSENM